MAVLSLAGISAVLLTYFFTYGSLERTALASHVPWLGNYLYAIIQAVIVIFLSGNFLQSDRKLDTTGVIWVRPVTNSAYIAGKVWVYAEQMLKELVPGVTVNSRLRSDEYGKRHFDSNGHLMGGYESGYERRLPDAVKDLQVPRRDWEVCMTIPENQWGYHKDWSLSYVKKTVESIGYIVHAVSMGKIWL